MEAITKATEVITGEQLDSVPDVSSDSGAGYSEKSKVYKDSKMGKLILIESESLLFLLFYN